MIILYNDMYPNMVSSILTSSNLKVTHEGGSPSSRDNHRQRIKINVNDISDYIDVPNDFSLEKFMKYALAEIHYADTDTSPEYISVHTFVKRCLGR